jgi:hypothetical protein
MSDTQLIIRTADQTRKAEIGVGPEIRAADVIQSAIQQWQLSEQTPYKLVNTTTGREFVATDTMSAELVSPGDVLEVQPTLVAAS